MIVPVAAGVLRQADGRVLIAQRPVGKIAAGRWEFPGGKIESGESVEAALRRELHEELGVELREARPLLSMRHAYTERTVHLHTWLVTGWAGEPHGREDQALSWVQPARIWDYDLLEADAPIVNALRLPEQLPVSPSLRHTEALLNWLQQVLAQGHRLLRLRVPSMDDAAYQACVDSLRPMLLSAGAELLIDRTGLDLGQPGVAGLHLPSRRLAQAPRGRQGWLFASCHSAEDLRAAERYGADAALLGAVAPTPSHPQAAGIGWSAFQQLVATVSLPVYAIGGVGTNDLARAFAAGAQGVAGIRDYCK